jgi:hypothetical protein
MTLISGHLHVEGEADLRQRRRGARLVEQAHDRPLALDRRQRRDTDVERPPAGADREAAVLRLPVLREVELREHLDAGDHAGGVVPRDPPQLADHTVHAHAREQRVLLRQEVDVAGPRFRSLDEDLVQEANRRRLGLVVGGDVEARRRPLDGWVALLEPREPELDLGARSDLDVEPEARRELELVDRLHVRRIGEGDLQALALDPVRHGHRAPEHMERNRSRRGVLDAAAQVGDGQVRVHALSCRSPPRRRAKP